jgi:hypothetical protein
MIAESIIAGTHTSPKSAMPNKKKPAKHHGATHQHKVTCPKAGKIGALSAHYESGNRGSAAIGYDNTGGWSYGKYQIETKRGTMKDFLKYAETKAPAASQKLVEAGGYEGALAGQETFKTAWIGLAANADFTDLQHNFIAARNYEPLAASVKFDCGLDVSSRSAALRDVIWSVAVQHGPGTQLISRALKDKAPAGMTDGQIIDAIYDERSGTKHDSHGHTVLKYFTKSTPNVQKEVLARYQQERYCAKQMLASESK